MSNIGDFQPRVNELNSSCYVFPKDIQDRMNNGETIASESVSQYKVGKNDLNTLDQECFITGHGAMSCECVRPDGSHFTGHGTTDIYSYNDQGTIKYCRTLYESCYVVCQRGT